MIFSNCNILVLFGLKNETVYTPKSERIGVNDKGLNRVEVNTTAVTKEGLRSYSVDNTVVNTAVGIPAIVINAIRAGPKIPKITVNKSATAGLIINLILTANNKGSEIPGKRTLANCIPRSTSIDGIEASPNSVIVRSRKIGISHPV